MKDFLRVGMFLRRSFLIAGLFLAMSGWGVGVTTTLAQSYPDHPIQLIIPGAAGSILDIAGRIVAEDLGKILGQQVIPVAKPGAGFTLGTDAVARSKKDGYTLAYTNSPAIIYSRILNPETVPYDPDKDLEPLGLHLFISTGVAEVPGAIPHPLHGLVQSNCPRVLFGREFRSRWPAKPGARRVLGRARLSNSEGPPRVHEERKHRLIPRPVDEVADTRWTEPRQVRIKTRIADIQAGVRVVLLESLPEVLPAIVPE